MNVISYAIIINRSLYDIHAQDSLFFNLLDGNGDIVTQITVNSNNSDLTTDQLIAAVNEVLGNCGLEFEYNSNEIRQHSCQGTNLDEIFAYLNRVL